MSGRPSLRRRRGRPLKFGRPARSVTITLPEDVLDDLRARNRDLGRAIVGLLPAASGTPTRVPSVVLHQSGRRAVIVVKPVPALRRLRGVDLVSLGDPDRALIAFTAGLSAAAFELHVQDLLDGPSMAPDDAEVVSQLAALLRDVRRTPGRALSDATIMVLDDTREPEPRGITRVRRRATRPRPQ